MNKKRVFFLDRDGTIIQNIPYLNNPSNISFLPDAMLTIKKLKTYGFDFIIITNQSGLARGLISFDQMTSIHKQIRSDFHRNGINLLDILYSPYHPSANHPSRKPNNGMIEEAFSKHQICREESYFVGDSQCDIEAGKRSGLKTFFIEGKTTNVEPDFRIKSLINIVHILGLK